MSNIWPVKALGEVVRITKGVTYSSTDYAAEGEGDYFLTIKCVSKGGGFNDEGLKFYKGPFSADQVIRPGELMVAKTDLTRAGDIIGSPLIAPEFGNGRNILSSMDLSILRPIDENTDSRFLFYRLMIDDARRYMLAHSAGSTVLHLETKALPHFRFQSPPLAVQNRIVEILLTVDAAIENTEATIEKYRRIKAGMMQEFITRGLDSDTHLRPPRSEAPNCYRDSALGWIPRDWRAEKLGEILRRCGGFLQTGPFGSQLHAHEYVEEGVPVVMPQDIDEGAISTDDIARIEERRAQELSRHRMREGDIVIARRGELSRAAVIRASEDGWLCGSGCFLMRIGRRELVPEFAALVYSHDLVQRQIVANSVGTTMSSLNNAVMEKLLFPVCDPNEQVRIIDGIETVAEHLRSAKEQAAKLRQQRTGLMRDLMAGGFSA